MDTIIDLMSEKDTNGGVKMFKFQKEIDDQIKCLAERQRVQPDNLMYIAFEWDTGFVVMEQDAWNKLSKRKKDALLAPMMKPRR